MFVAHINVIIIAPIDVVMLIVAGACGPNMQATSTTAM